MGTEGKCVACVLCRKLTCSTGLAVAPLSVSGLASNPSRNRPHCKLLLPSPHVPGELNRGLSNCHTRGRHWATELYPQPSFCYLLYLSLLAGLKVTLWPTQTWTSDRPVWTSRRMTGLSCGFWCHLFWLMRVVGLWASFYAPVLDLLFCCHQIRVPRGGAPPP